MHFLNTALLAAASLAGSAFAHYEPTLGSVGPTNAMLFLNGFHFISGNSSQEIQANHYCAIMSDDFIQCTVYMPGSNPMRLAGVEYIISGSAFEKLPWEERQLWHSHQFEVTSGFLVQPNLPPNVDHAIMEVLVGTYGKTFHTWPYASMGTDIPHGIPELVMGYTGDGQMSKKFQKARDKMFGTDTEKIRDSRLDINAPPVIDGADSWRYGFTLNLGLTNVTAEPPF